MAKPEVDTKYGRLRGQEQKNIEGGNFFAFKGIPYAKPPVGKLRFKDPVRAEPWSGTRDALEFGPICIQHDLFFNFTDGSDDCLYLNVYTKSLDLNAKQPVMVWIHGGGFLFGSGNDTFYGPDYLLKKDVVLVTINYRLGIFGFLNLDHEVATGNQGLKDQVFALRWVKENIMNFGGDPNNVTIFGESAGGASVHFLTMSPMAKGLFHKAISHSGVSVCPWGYSYKSQLETTAYLCEYLGKKVTNPVEMVEFLQTVHHSKILEALDYIKITKEFAYNPYCPEVDKKSPEPFLPVTREEAAKEGAHVPYIIGHNSSEGNLMLGFFEKEVTSIDDKILNAMLHPRSLKALEGYNLTLEEVKHIYCKDGNISEDRVGLSNMLGDILFILGIHKIIEYQIEKNAAPTYMYQFSYDKGYDVAKMLYKMNMSGATHMDELLYIFSMKFFEKLNIESPKKGTPNYKKMEQMVEMWTNFAKTGMPTPTTSDAVPLHWLPVNDGQVLRYLDIGEELHMKKMLNVKERFSYKKNSSE